MNYGAEPADQVVRYSLEGMEYSLKITGNVAKHVAIFIAAALKDQKKTRGKTRLTRMLKEQRPMKFFTVPGDRLKEFAKEAKARGILYVVIKDKVNPDQTEVMVFADDAAKMNRVLDRMNLDFVKAESGSMVTEAVEKENAPEKAEKIGKTCAEEFAEEAPLAENVVDSKALAANEQIQKEKELVAQVEVLQQQLKEKQIEEEADEVVKTYDVVLRVKPEKVSQIKSEVINGQKCLVIPMAEDEHANVNGVNTKV